ncbi:DUF6944 family repetitive protein [Halalkalibacter okhensis]|uniref:Uncharacterized protein n=1 Tax=Halalkalibacter okhensis TaxID=333138 RepID=A0A0B0IGX6_9BACI|nr:hypothetical protein [Halalkalibacter okhensis]KHF40565.1 hypothetical protein LQ50_08570 [Halalkalibacter okhensis]
MDNQSKSILGSGISALGTIVSAVGSTPLQRISDDALKSLNLWGNVLQATGSALQADGQEQFTFSKLGNQVQSVGNLTVISGLLGDEEEESNQKLNIAGNWMQALGAIVSLGDDLDNQSNSLDQSYNVIGNLLQGIGNSLQAISGQYSLQHTLNQVAGDPDTLNATGSWIQAIGAVLSYFAQLQPEVEEQ